MSLRNTSLKKFRKLKAQIKADSWDEYEQKELELQKRLLQEVEPTIKGTVRITAGKVKNYQIDIPRQSRALTDRVKMSIFNILSSDIANKSVLDMYAGSGSFGLEALSRGASTATFVDAGKHVEKVLHDNVRKTGFLTETTIIREKVEDFLESGDWEFITYDIIFLDPPFKLFNTRNVAKMEVIINRAKLFLPGIQNPNINKFKGVIIVKHPRKYVIKKLDLPELQIVETYDFGLNSVTFLIVDLKAVSERDTEKEAPKPDSLKNEIVTLINSQKETK